MHPVTLLMCLGSIWILLQLWLLPLVKERWKAEDLKGKMAQASTLVAIEKLRDLASAGIIGILAVLLLVAGANVLSEAGIVWPKVAIAATGAVFATAKALSGNYGTALVVLGLVGAAIVLYMAAARARTRVSEVWEQKSKANLETFRTHPAVLDNVRQDPDLRTMVEEVDAALAVIRAQDGASAPDAVALEGARDRLNKALTRLSMEMARKEIDFPAAAGQATAAEASEPRSTWARIAGVLSSKRLGEDLGLVRKSLSRVVSALLFVSLMGWAAEPLADSLQLAVNNLRVQLLQAQAQQDLSQFLSVADKANEPDDGEPSTLSTDAAAQILSQAFWSDMANTPLLPPDGGGDDGRPPVLPSGGGGEDGRRAARTELVRALLAGETLHAAPDAPLAERAQAEAVRAPAPAAAEPPSAGTRHVEAVVKETLREVKERQPKRFATWMKRVEARYSSPMSPMDAQGKVVTKLAEDAFGTVDVKPEGELANQTQKLGKDIGKEALKAWTNAKLKTFLAETLEGIARPGVERSVAFEVTAQSKAFVDSLKAAEGKGWQASETAVREAQTAQNVAQGLADQAEEPKRQAVREQLSGFDQMFKREDPPASPGAGPTSPGGGGGGHARSGVFAAMSRSFLVRGVLVGQAADGGAIDVPDIRWTISKPTGSVATTRVSLDLRIATTPRSLGKWTSIGSFDAAVVNQGIRYAADRRVVAATILPFEGTGPMDSLVNLHPALIDTPLGCRVYEIDQVVDAFTGRRPIDKDALALLRQRDQFGRLVGSQKLAEDVAAQSALACSANKVSYDAWRVGLTGLSPQVVASTQTFLGSQPGNTGVSTALLSRAQSCAAAPNIGRCFCDVLAPQGLPERYWFPETHTSQVREKKVDLTADMAWLKPSSNRLDHLAFWIHTVFSPRDAQTRRGDDSRSVALDFTPEQLKALDAVVRNNVASYVVDRLNYSTVDEFLGPLEEFVLVQRLTRAALSGKLGRDFPLAKVIELERTTREFVPEQTTARWRTEDLDSEMKLEAALEKTDVTAAKQLRNYREDWQERSSKSKPMCAAASK